MGMIQSKPIQGRLLPNELLHEMNKFMPLNGLIKCGQSNSTLSALAIPRAQKVHAKLISLYFADISTLASWFKQWARQMAEVRANIHRHYQTFDEDEAWFNLFCHNLTQFDHSLSQCWDKITEILNADQAGNILALFNFPPAFQNEIRQIRASHIEKALAPAEFELSQLHPENNSIWNEMLIHFRGILDEEEFYDLEDWFSRIHGAFKLCENMLKMAANHMNSRS